MAKLKSDWSILKNGCSICGIASKIADDDEITLTSSKIEKIIFGFALFLKNALNLEFSKMTVAVGHDTRSSADRIRFVIINSLRSLGITVYNSGISSTPSMYTAIKVLSCTASIEITADCCLPNYNGMKFFTENGEISEDDMHMILEVAERKNFQKIFKENKVLRSGDVKKIRVLSYYSSNIKKKICDMLGKKEKDKPLKQLKIVVDTAGGVGGYVVDEILKPLGASTVFSKKDEKSQNHLLDLNQAETVNSIKKATLSAKADIGVIFDADADHIVLVDKNGTEINRNKLIAIASEIILKEHPNTSIVTDSITSEFLKKFIQNLGGKQVRFKHGYRNVISAAKNLNSSGADCKLAIDTFGHTAFQENDFIDDGVYFLAKIIVRLVELKSENKDFSDILELLKTEKEFDELRLPLIEQKNEYQNLQKLFSYIKNNIKNIKGCEIDKNNVDGLRLNFSSQWQDGWCLLRKSMHEPSLVLFVESYVTNGLNTILSAIKPFFDRFDFFVDSTSLLRKN